MTVGASTTDLATTASYPEMGDSVRVALVYDRSPNGTATTYGQVYSTAVGNGAFGMRNMSYIDRFDVLAVDEVQLCAAGPNASRIDRYVNCELEIRFDGTGSGIGNVEIGNFTLVYADQNASGAAQRAILGVVRVTYTDF